MDRNDQMTLFDLLLSDYGEALAGEIMAGYVARPLTLRINTLKMTAEEGLSALEKAGFSCERVSWYPDALILRGATEKELSATELYREGMIYLQSLSSMLPPLYLGPKKGESVLDMTAAPGGKTTELAALSGGGALITACERDKTRYARLLFNLNRQGAGRVTPLLCDSASLDEFFSFDKILLDAPCSGSGTVIYGKPHRIDEAYVGRCAAMQEKLLKKALKLLRKGGEMVYSTCSVLRRENEGTLISVLKESGVRLVPIDPFPGLPLLPGMDGTICVKPSELYEGFFLAKLRRE